MEVLKNLVFWHWLIIALVLFILEVFAPGAFFVWMAVAAAVVGVLMTVVPIPWAMQFLLFSVLSVASIVGWKMYKAKYPDEETHPVLNQRAMSMVGRRFTLAEAIVNGVGKVRADDSTWKVRGPDLPEGTTVTVTEVDGTILVVTTKDA